MPAPYESAPKFRNATFLNLQDRNVAFLNLGAVTPGAGLG
jgi:hypothetical protein